MILRKESGLWNGALDSNSQLFLHLRKGALVPSRASPWRLKRWSRREMALQQSKDLVNSWGQDVWLRDWALDSGRPGPGLKLCHFMAQFSQL